MHLYHHIGYSSVYKLEQNPPINGTIEKRVPDEIERPLFGFLTSGQLFCSSFRTHQKTNRIFRFF